jgi:hypothetical protein
MQPAQAPDDGVVSEVTEKPAPKSLVLFAEMIAWKALMDKIPFR